MHRSIAIALLALGSAAAAPDELEGQRRSGRGPRLEVSAGYATFGRFLEQRSRGFTTVGVIDAERELSAAGALVIAGGIAMRPFGGPTELRLGASLARPEMRLRADGYDAGEDIELDDDLTVVTASGELVRYIGEGIRSVSPYGVAGFSATWWSRPEERNVGRTAIFGDEETLLRWGAVGGVGVQIRAASRLALRLEATRVSSGNPFDGEDAWRVINPEDMFEEPDRVGITRLTGAVSFGFGGGRPRCRGRHC